MSTCETQLGGSAGSGWWADCYWPELGEEDDVADAFLAEEHHAEAVDAHAHAAGGGHAVFEGDEEILVEFLLFAAGLVFEAFALFDGIVLLGVGRGDFLAVDAALEDFHGGGVFG